MFNSNRSEIISTFGIITATALGLYLSSFYSYLLFHSLIEITTIAIAFTIFILTWNTRKILSNNYLTVLGIGYAFIGLIDLLHTLAYKGMNVFPGCDANLSTQLWTAARSLQAVTLFTAPLFLERGMSRRAVFGIYGAVTSLFVAMIYSGAFPVCCIKGKGLATFKNGSEYLIVAILLASLYLFHRMRKHFDRAVYLLTFSSITCTIISEIMFTSYLNVYDMSSMAGHFFKLAAFYLMYRALLVTGLQEPYDLIFRDLARTEEELREAYDTLEEKVRERTAALRESEQKYRSLAENSPDNIVRYNREGVTVYVNPVVVKTVGCTAADMIGTRIRERHMDGSYEAYAQAVDNALASGEDGEIEFIVPVPGVETIVHQIRVIAERSEQGEVIGALAIGRDITERKRADDTLRERERKFRTLAENSPDCILRYDTSCRCIYANPRIETILGIPAGGMPGKTPIELFLAGEYREYQTRIEEVLRTGTDAEMEVVLPDIGEGVQHHHVRFTAERGEHDDVVGVLVIGHDITERKRMEQTLRENEERFRLLVELSPDLIFIRHDEWIVYANPAAARMVGANSAEELIGKSVLDFALPERRESLKMLIAANSTKQTGEVMPSFDGTLVRLDGSLVPVELTAVRFQYRGMSCSQLIMRDITGRKREEQMTQARLRMLETAYAVGLSLDDTLRVMLDEIEARTGSCIGFYYFWEEEQQMLTLHGWSTNTVATMCATEGAESHYAVAQAGVWADCVRERRPVIHNDYASLPHRRGMPDGHAPVIRELVVPIFRGDRIVAIIGVGNKQGEYNDADVQLAMLLGDFSWEIVSHKQAEDMLLAKQQRLTDMTMELSLVEERERRRIATELHDNISQSLLLGKIKLRTLIGAALPTQSLQALNEILKIQDQTIKSVRSLTQQLSPPILSIAGLEDALEWLAERMQEDYGLCVVFVDDKQPKPLTEDMRAIVFQTCRELLINVAKHAETESARVVIGREDGRLCLTVDDRGKGFDLSGSAVRGFGLFSIRERIKYLGGDVSIESAPGQGTQVTLRVALAEG